MTQEYPVAGFAYHIFGNTTLGEWVTEVSEVKLNKRPKGLTQGFCLPSNFKKIFFLCVCGKFLEKWVYFFTHYFHLSNKYLIKMSLYL